MLRTSGKAVPSTATLADFQCQAEKVRRTEIAKVVGNIKQATSQCGLVAACLGLGGGEVRYRDGGNTWSGWELCPRWFVAALATGRNRSRLAGLTFSPKFE